MSDGKISLCLIVGNVQEYIATCLKSFLPIADEVVLVRAIGNQSPDETFAIATNAQQEFAQSDGGRYVPIVFGDYKNKHGHEDWPHVDDFAAARQMSFDLASHEYCFWCDSDDVLQEGAAQVREHARKGEFDVYLFTYRILGTGFNLPRERLIRKAAGRWKHAVHEYFDFSKRPARGVQDDNVVITHMPHHDKQGSHARNLRILQSIPDEAMTTGLLFHLQEELIVAGDLPGAVKAAERFLAQPDVGRPEKVDLFLNLASVANNPDEKYQLLLQAYGADPRRREALGALAAHALDFGRVESGLAFARQMMATPPPQRTPWNNRECYYGWVGEDLLAQALRLNGRRGEAEKLRLDGFKKYGEPLIALIHATRGRPEQAARARKMWLAFADQPERIEHLFICDEDDASARLLNSYHKLTITPGGGCVAAWNNGVFATQAPVIVQMSDDWTPPKMWDRLILERLGAVNEPKVLAVSDGHRTDALLCLAICTRAYVHQDMFLFHPGFKSMYSDNWFTHQAYARGQVIEARDLVFTHHHPIFANGAATPQEGALPWDETYAVQNHPQRYEEGRVLFQQLLDGTDWSSVPGFFDYFMFYDYVESRLRDGDCVAEVGVWLGRSLIYLAQKLKRNGKKVKLYAVDWFKGETDIPEHQTVVAAHGGSIRPAFEENLKRCGVADMVEILEGDSAEMAARLADESLAFCFIDAAHDLQSVRRDLAAWTPKVKADGIIAGHDAQWHEVATAVQEKFGPAAKFMGAVWMKSEEWAAQSEALAGAPIVEIPNPEK